MNLFEKITAAKNPFKEGEKPTSCIYPNQFNGCKPEVVMELYCHSTRCTVYFGISRHYAHKIIDDSYAYSHEMAVYFEHELMPYCKENTEWKPCHRYGIDYTEIAMQRDEKGRFFQKDHGCEGSCCDCEPFGGTGFSWGITDKSDFNI
jgi:hypothetical protein